jgi:hypothetical protein
MAGVTKPHKQEIPMRYAFISLVFVLQLLSTSAIAFAQVDVLPKEQVYISPNAQTGRVADIILGSIQYPQNLTFPIGIRETLVFEFSGAHISEVSTLRILNSYDGYVWENFKGYEVENWGRAGSEYGMVTATITKTQIRLTLMRWAHDYYFGGPLIISGIRCNVAPFTKGTNTATPPMVNTYVIGIDGSQRVFKKNVQLATFADPMDLRLKAEPEYTWSNGLWHVAAIVRVSEAGDFRNGFETQSAGSLNDATQLVVTLQGMPKGMVLRKAVVADTTSSTITATVAPALAFPLSGSPIGIPVFIFGQEAGRSENIDVKLEFDVAGVADKLPLGSVSASVTLGPQTSSDPEKPIPFDAIPGDGVGGNRYLDCPNDLVSLMFSVEWPMSSVNLTVNAGGALTFDTNGASPTSQVGYATSNLTVGADPYGTAVLSLRQNGVTVTEAGVPASPPTKQARIFIDHRAAVDAVPGHPAAGKINISTGIAAVNPASVAADVIYALRDSSGTLITTAYGTIEAGKHFACFIDQLKDQAPDFNLPIDFPTAIQFGSLEIASSQPISVVALRGTINQRNEFLITTAPVADLIHPSVYDPMYFPQLVDGGGYTTSLLLLNSSNRTASGTLQIFDNNGAPLVVNQVGGTAGASFRYSIPPNGTFRFQTDGAPLNTVAGWVKLVTDFMAPTPVGLGVFSYNPESILVSESGIPATNATAHARVYVDLSGNHNTGLAIANVASTGAAITIKAYETDGTTSVGTSQGPLQLAAFGHDAKFADQIISGLPAGFKGVLDISANTAFAALTLRSLVNERNDFLMTTFPVANLSQTAPSPIVFPQIVDGGGYATEFILVGAGQASSNAFSFYGENGVPWAAKN